MPDFPSLIEAIYRASTIRGEWMRVLELIASAVEADGYGVGLYRGNPPRLVWSYPEIDPFPGGATDYGSIAISAAQSGERVGVVFCTEDVCPTQRLADWEVYEEWMKPRGFESGIGAVMPLPHGDLLGIGLQHREPNGFTQAHLELVSDLLPHLGRAAAIGQHVERIELARDVMGAAIESLDFAMVTCDASGRVQSQSRGTRHLNESADGAAIGNHGIVFSDPTAHDHLELALRNALVAEEPHGSDFVARRSSGKHPYVVTVTPLYPSPHAPPSCALVLFVDPEAARAPTPRLLREAFGLTPAETRVARLLAMGLGTEEVSERLGITRQTARNHLKRIFSKTGTGRQGELVALLCRVAAISDPEGARAAD